MNRARQLEEEIGRLSEELLAIQGNCQHRVPERKNPKDWHSAECSECAVNLGWYCPDNPAHFCEYDDDEDPVHDECLHCGQPEERK